MLSSRFIASNSGGGKKLREMATFHQECLLRPDPVFDSARIEAFAFRPDDNSTKRFGFVIAAPKALPASAVFAPAVTAEPDFAISQASMASLDKHCQSIIETA
jgi:hypothetical protein